MYACFFLIFTDGCHIWMEAPGMAGCHADGETLFPDSRLNQLFIEEGTAWDDWNESLPVIIDW